MTVSDTVTLYFCGSGNSQKQNDEFLIPFLYNHTKGKQHNMFELNASAAIFDGPGGAWWLPRYNAERVKKRLEKNEFKKALHLNEKNRPSDKIGRLPALDGFTGAGATSNVLQAWAWLSMMYEKKPEKFKKINLVGFSRGAYSCMILAHVLQQDNRFPQDNVEVNIFAFDPVPGGQNTWTHALNDAFHRNYPCGKSFKQAFNIGKPEELPPIVKNYHSIVQGGIRKKMWGWTPIGKDSAFQSVVPSWGAGTHRPDRTMKIFMMPGRHSASVKNATKFKHSYEIGRHICASFLLANGTKLESGLTLTPQQLERHLIDLADKVGGKKKNDINAGYHKFSKHRTKLSEKIELNANNDEFIDLLPLEFMQEYIDDLELPEAA